MKIHSILLAVYLGLLVEVPAFAAPTTQPSEYFTIISPVQSHDANGSATSQILVKALVLQPAVGAKDELNVLTRPYVVLEEGRRQRVESAMSDDLNGPAKMPAAHDAWSGVRIDVYHPKGEDKVVAITTIWERGSIIWTGSQTVAIGQQTQLDAELTKTYPVLGKIVKPRHT